MRPGNDDLASAIRADLARGLIAKAKQYPWYGWSLKNRRAPTSGEVYDAVYDAIEVTVSADGKIRTVLHVPGRSAFDEILDEILSEAAGEAFKRVVERLVSRISEYAARIVGIVLDILVNPADLGGDDVTRYSPAEIVFTIASYLNWNPPPIPTIGPAR
ncbi:MAG: hypothetical protein HYY17_14670 [Planctomycetes bacterium]|nr:hypothetical protein [Planctomycetota bacterium]